MKKFMNLSFTIGLVIWFLTAIYMSVVSVFDIFMNTNPYIANYILAGSFLWVTGFGIYNKIKNNDFINLNQLEDMKTNRKTGCKSCKKKR